MIQYNVAGCGGGLEMMCDGGCFEILKVLYSCKEERDGSPEQLVIVQDICDKKASCNITTSRELFGYAVCKSRVAQTT
jgi:hypothetical protein